MGETDHLHDRTPAEEPLRWKVAGMDCGSCAKTIEEGLRKLPGVRRVSVDFASATMEVEGTATPEAIERRLRQLGYRLAEPRSDSDPDAPRSAGAKAFLTFLWRQPRLRMALALATALLFGLAARVIVPSDASRILLDLLLVATVVVAGAPIFHKGLRALVFSRRITIDLLMTLAATGALLIGETGEAATVVLLFTLGEALEAFSAARARDSLHSLLALQPQTATVLRPCGHSSGSTVCSSRLHPVTIPAQELVPGDLMLVRPGERLAADGVIRRGISGIDQAAVTGESLPVTRTVGDQVMAGTINMEAALEVEVTRPSADSTIARIARLVEQAQARRSPAERFIDRFARWYTPAVVLLALAVVLVPVAAFGQPLLDSADGSRGWLYRGLALLIVACPCALVISIPVTVVSSLTRLARLGVLVKGGEQLDRLADVRMIAFDKTGTLTSGRPSVSAARSLDCVHEHEGHPGCDSCDDLVAIAAAVESGSEHPLAHAIVEHARARGLHHRYPRAEAITAVPGRGVIAELAGEAIAVGNAGLLSQRNIALPSGSFMDLIAPGRTLMLVARGPRVIGAIGVEDPVRPESAAALEELRRADPPLRTAMLTGDGESVARHVAERVGGIDEIRAGLMPSDKLEAIRTLQLTHGPVAMVGDGINDGPALARSDVGIAMGGIGTAQAMEIADIVLIHDDLRRLPTTVRVARRNRTVVKQNIALSLGLKLAFVGLATAGWATLWLAVVADVGATVLVTLNGMRMLRVR